MFKSAFYEKEITPPLGCNLPGYFNVRLGSDVKDRLYAKAFVIDNGTETVAIAGLDAIAITAEIRRAVTDRVCEFTCIKAENILLSANHTHTGPPVIEGIIVDECVKNETEYKNVLGKLIADCIILAYKRLENSELAFGTGTVTNISFVRNYYMKNSTPTTNPGRMNPETGAPVTDIDPELPILFVKSDVGRPLGAVICFACHQDCVDGTEYSGDYSSALSKELKRLYGEDFVTLFMAGTCGNINHFDVTRAEDASDHYVMMGKILAGEASKVIALSKPVKGNELSSLYRVIKMNRAEIDPEVLREAQHIAATVKPVPGAKIAADGTDPDQYNLAMSKMLIEFAEGPESFDVPLQVIRIGDLLVYGFPSEIFCQFGKQVKESSLAPRNIAASLCNDWFGYVPTEDMYYPTIYESKPGSAKLPKDAGSVMAEELIKMGKELMR